MPWLSEQLHNSLKALEMRDRLNELLEHRRNVLATDAQSFAAYDAQKEMLKGIDVELSALVEAVT